MLKFYLYDYNYFGFIVIIYLLAYILNKKYLTDPLFVYLNTYKYNQYITLLFYTHIYYFVNTTSSENKNEQITVNSL